MYFPPSKYEKNIFSTKFTRLLVNFLAYYVHACISILLKLATCMVYIQVGLPIRSAGRQAGSLISVYFLSRA